MKLFWLDKHVSQWNAAIKHDHKPQAVIVSGAAGMGKSDLLQQIVADLVCREANPGHCGACQNCTLFSQSYHPDVHSVDPDKNVVKVKMIRELTEFFTSTPHCSDYKIAVINQADGMNVAAANALLKVLEEPPSRGILFLLTDSKHQLMPTIRSRCISMDVMVLPAEKKQLNNWLKSETSCDDLSIQDALYLCDYQPKLALNLLQNNELNEFGLWLDNFYSVFSHSESTNVVAKQLLEKSNVEFWPLLQRYCLHILKSNFNVKKHEIFANHPLNQLIKKSPKVIHIIIKFTEQIQQIMLNLNTQIKTQLLIESMLVDIKSEFNHRK